jgi:hypothetical protein
MENPATWGRAEGIISRAYAEWSESRNKGIIGLSLARQIADALRDAGLLIEPQVEENITDVWRSGSAPL